MEPLDCVIELSDDGCDIWAGSHMATLDQIASAKILGLAPAQVRIHTQFAGGSLGRRAVPDSDFVAEAAEKAGWGPPLAAGKGRGIAIHESFSSFVTEIAEVTVADDGAFSVDHVTCAVDCGIAVTPESVNLEHHRSPQRLPMHWLPRPEKSFRLCLLASS